MARRKTRAGWRRCSHHSRGFDHVLCSPASRRSAGTPSSRARRAAPSTLGARCLKCRDTRTPQKAQARRLRGHQQSPALLTQRAAPQPVRSQAARAALPTRRLASLMLTVRGRDCFDLGLSPGLSCPAQEQTTIPTFFFYNTSFPKLFVTSINRGVFISLSCRVSYVFPAIGSTP